MIGFRFHFVQVPRLDSIGNGTAVVMLAVARRVSLAIGRLPSRTWTSKRRNFWSTACRARQSSA